MSTRPATPTALPTARRHGTSIASSPSCAPRAPGRAGPQRNGAAAKCPSREALRGILDGFFAALFPTHFGLPDLTDEGIDYFVGHKLDATAARAVKQVQRELQFAARPQTTAAPISARARHCAITREFAARLPQVRALLESDVHAAYQGDPAAKSIEEVRFCYPGITGDHAPSDRA